MKTGITPYRALGLATCLALLGLALSTGAQTPATGESSTPPQSQSNPNAPPAASQQQSATPPAPANALDLAINTAIPATLETTLDAKRAKPGDLIEARVTRDMKQNGSVVLKRGTRLNGHLTLVQTRSKETAQSALGIVFDNAVVNGQQVPLHLGVQALAASSSEMAATSPMSTGMPPGNAPPGDYNGMGGGNPPQSGEGPGGGPGISGPAFAGGASPGSTGGVDETGQLTPGSKGVFGLHGLRLVPTYGEGAQVTSVVVSSTQNVHLDSGTQLMLEVLG